jgi:amidase
LTPERYASLDALALAEAVRSGEVTPSELVEHALAARDATAATNAVVHRDDGAARAVASQPRTGPFAGVPIAIKDFDGMVAGEPFTGSTRFLEGFRAAHTHAAMARIERAGFVPIGRTNLPELAILGTTESEWRGPCRNPWALDHSTGGSSGGSAAAVAARVVPVAHGGDGGGSLRIPASMTGLVGLKPTRGRVSLAPDGEGWSGLVQWGALTRTVRDTAAMLDVMAGPEPGDPYAAPAGGSFLSEIGREPGRLRVAVYPGSIYGRDVHPVCAAAAVAAGERLAALGHEVVEDAPDLPRDALVRAYLTIVAVGTAAELRAMEGWTGRAATPSSFEASTWFLAQVGRQVTGLELEEARAACHDAGRRMGAFHARHDLWVTPTVAVPPPPIGTGALSRTDRLGLGVLRAAPFGPALRAVFSRLAADALERTPNTQLMNMTGQPAISLPLGVHDGLPIGVQLSARIGEEAVLLRVAGQLEADGAFHAGRPPLCYG